MLIGESLQMPPMPLSPRERRRRVILLCCSFARHLAIYKAGFGVGRALLEQGKPGFWRVISGSCLDICILEWCKLFAEPNGKHYWKKVVSEGNRKKFEIGLLGHLGVSAKEFGTFAAGVRLYRDKFIAHLDEERVMHIPQLANAIKAVWYLFDFMTTNECEAGDLPDLADELEKFESGYNKCVAQAEEIFRANSSL
jgi:hypothetical protein